MATFSKLILSGSTDGSPILVSTTSGSYTSIHTTQAGTSSLDEVWLYAYNDATSSIVLTLLWGGTSEPSNVSRATLLSQSGRTLLTDGKLLRNGLSVQAYATVGGFVTIDGFINRIS